MVAAFPRNLRFGLALAATLACAPVGAATVGAARLWPSPDHTRAVFDLDGRVDYKVFLLDKPDRLVLDLNASKVGSEFSAPAASGVVKAVRSGKPMAGVLRVVIDLAQAVKPKSFLLDPTGKLGHRLVIDLYPRDAGVEAAPIKTADEAPGDARKVVIAIDPGHGGEDPGALGPGGTTEKSVTLAISRQLAAMIDAESGMSSHLVRDGDYFVGLEQRYAKAREAKADLLVSIHADAIEGGGASGSSVYILSKRGASSEAARWLADRENQSDLVGGVSLDKKDNTLAFVLLDLSQGASLAASDAVANRVLVSLSKVGPVHKREVQRANFVVLRSPDVPSILVETAFITNPLEERRLANSDEQQKLAEAVLSGVRDYFASTSPPGTWFAANRQPVKEHIVSRGETLALIAQQHGVSVARLRSVNQLKVDNLRPGVVLRIPTSS